MTDHAQTHAFPKTRTVNENAHPDHANVLVVFVGHTECGCLRWLKDGFKHCFVALQSSDKWIICDSLKNHMKFSIVELPSSFSLSRFYLDRGHIVLAGHEATPSEGSLFLPELLTCVGIVKRIIGIRSFWTVTPWQLFCLLRSMSHRWRLVQ